MMPLRSGVAIVLCAGSATAAWAIEPSPPKFASEAVLSGAGNAATVASRASKAALDSLPTGPLQRKSAAKSVAGGKTREAVTRTVATRRPASVPEPVRKPAEAKPEDGAKSAADPVPTEWPAVDIELAKARCTQLLKGIEAVAVPEAPVRQGECGAPAPVRLVSIGKAPEVALSPPPLLTCDMVAALYRWMKDDVQPLAKKHLGASVIKIESMSDYSCRHAYGRAGNRLSEHGRANALDIRGFVTTNALTAYVLQEWGQTKRQIEAQIAAAKAAAVKAETERIEAEKKAQDNLRDPKAASPGETRPLPPAAVGTTSGAPAGGIARTTIIDGVPRLTVTLPGSQTAPKPSNGLGAAPRHLGGPKPASPSNLSEPPAKAGTKRGTSPTPAGPVAASPPSDTAPPAPAGPPSKTSLFLHGAHGAACRVFGTTLGPEANDAHLNHFHVDMAERKLSKVCD